MEQLGIDFKLFIAQVTNFLIFFFIFKKFIVKPLNQTIEKEKKKEAEKEKILKDLETQHQRMVEEETKWRKELEKEKDKILAETKKVADQIKIETINQAK